MTATAPPAWFDKFWEQESPKLPIYLRGDTIKNLAWAMFQVFIDYAGKYVKTPDGMKDAIAFARISAIVKGSRAVMDAPDPSPEQVVEAVQRMVDRGVKP